MAGGVGYHAAEELGESRGSERHAALHRGRLLDNPHSLHHTGGAQYPGYSLISRLSNHLKGAEDVFRSMPDSLTLRGFQEAREPQAAASPISGGVPPPAL
jgi:hypothetical protein